MTACSAPARRDAVTSMQQDALLAKLEAEERAGWPDLPWPPPEVLPTAEQEAILCRLLAVLADVARSS